jgi:hypothetical protein
MTTKSTKPTDPSENWKKDTRTWDLVKLLIECRDTLPAISVVTARLRNIDLRLADRIDTALKPWAIREMVLCSYQYLSSAEFATNNLKAEGFKNTDVAAIHPTKDSEHEPPSSTINTIAGGAIGWVSSARGDINTIKSCDRRLLLVGFVNDDIASIRDKSVSTFLHDDFKLSAAESRRLEAAIIDDQTILAVRPESTWLRNRVKQIMLETGGNNISEVMGI